MRKALIFATLSLGLAACGGDPCEEYVDYLCDCLDDETCDDTKTTYENADADLKDECSAALDEAETLSKECQSGGSGDSGGGGEG
jgi:hypothetical protein